MKYLLKLWLTTLLVSPFLVCCLLAVSGDKEWINGGTAALLLSLLVFTGFFLSLPAVIVLFFLKAFLLRTNKNITMVKTMLCLYAVIAVYLVFLVADYTFVFSLRNNLWWPVLYCIVTTFAIFFFDINPADNALEPNNNHEQPRTDR